MELGELTLDIEIKSRKATLKYFSNSELFSLTKSLVDGIHSLHVIMSIAHRDIKPSNIIKVKNKYKIADLGTCKEYNTATYG